MTLLSFVSYGSQFVICAFWSNAFLTHPYLILTNHDNIHPHVKQHIFSHHPTTVNYPFEYLNSHNYVEKKHWFFAVLREPQYRG